MSLSRCDTQMLVGAMLLILARTLPVFAQDADSRLVVAADRWCPYNCQPGSERPGYLLELLREVFSPLGVDVEYRLMPWKRALVSAETGAIDAAVGVVEGNHGQNIIGRESLGLDETVLVIRKGEPFTYQGAASLDDRAIGVVASYTYDNHGPLDAYLAVRKKNHDGLFEIYQDNPLESLYSMLRHARIDLFPENRYVARYEAIRLGYAKEVVFVPTAAGDRVFIAFTPNTRGRHNAEILDNGVRALRRSGRLGEILGRYAMDDWSQGSPPR